MGQSNGVLLKKVGGWILEVSFNGVFTVEPFATYRHEALQLFNHYLAGYAYTD